MRRFTSCLCALLGFLLAALPPVGARPARAEPLPPGATLTFTLTLTAPKCQIAVWLADAQGHWVDTVYVTRKVGRKGLGNRKGGLDDRVGGARLSALPVWAFARHPQPGSAPAYPSRDAPLPDAVSGATPPAGVFTWAWTPPAGLAAGAYTWFVEINRSFDRNAAHDYSWYRGQPSVVWRGPIALGATAAVGAAQPIGHGHPAGADGAVDPDLSTLTSARGLLTDARVAYRP